MSFSGGKSTVSLFSTSPLIVDISFFEDRLTPTFFTKKYDGNSQGKPMEFFNSFHVRNLDEDFPPSKSGKKIILLLTPSNIIGVYPGVTKKQPFGGEERRICIFHNIVTSHSIFLPFSVFSSPSTIILTIVNNCNFRLYGTHKKNMGG